MPATLYQSTDSGAPQLTATAGSLIQVLDAVLVNGYGSKSPAGWTKEFSGTNTAVYRNGPDSAARTFFRIEDISGSYATVVGYHDMTDINTGTYRIPSNTSYTTNLGRQIYTSSPHWLALADSKTLFLSYNTNASNDRVAWYLGDGVSPIDGDVGNCLIIGGGQGNFAWSPTYHSVSSWPTQKDFFRKSNCGLTLVGTPVCRGLPTHGLQATSDTGSPPDNESGFLSVTQADGRLVATYLHYFYFDSGSSSRMYGGRLRWLVALAHYSTNFNQLGVTYQGVGDFAGKTLYSLGRTIGGHYGGPVAYLALCWDTNDS